jgi:hypothetical protein
LSLNGGLPKVVSLMLIALSVCPIAASAIMSQYSFIHDLTINPLSVKGPEVTVSITCKIYFTDQAWSTFRYKDGSFPYMSDWWEEHEGETFTYMGHSVKLQKIDFTLLQHTEQFDEINALVKVHFIN